MDEGTAQSVRERDEARLQTLRKALEMEQRVRVHLNRSRFGANLKVPNASFRPASDSHLHQLQGRLTRAASAAVLL